MYIYTHHPMDFENELTEEELIYCNLQDYAKSITGKYMMIVNEAEPLDYEMVIFEDFAEQENIDMDVILTIHEKIGLRRDRGYFSLSVSIKYQT